MKTLRALLLSSAVLCAACGSSSNSGSSSAKPATTSPTAATGVTMQLTSTAFTNNGPIPRVHTCDDAGTIPPLTIEGDPPAGTQSLALIVHDPDAPAPGGFTHWVVVDIPPDATAIRGRDLTPWRPPCPPSGTHHYRFTLYAERAAPASADDIPKNAIGQVTLVGTYRKA
jgi:phosphatidylethanolamine-binding protein (PEBP) family uncharacterized protein